MNKKTIIIIVAFAVIAAIGIAVASLQPENDGTDTTQSTVSTAPGSEAGTDGSSVVNISPDTVCCTVYAPKHCTVLLGEAEVPYIESAKCYRLFTELTGKHTVTVSRYGYKTVTKEFDFDKEKFAEMHVSLEATEEYKKEAEKAAQEILADLIEICAEGKNDLSSFSFSSEKDKSEVQKVVDGIISSTDIDTDSYKTGKINVSAIRCNGFDESGSTVSWSDDIEGSIVTFTIEYNYSWKYEGESYQDSGIDSKTFNPFVKLENINGQWCIKSVYLNLKKDIH